MYILAVTGYPPPAMSTWCAHAPLFAINFNVISYRNGGEASMQVGQTMHGRKES